MSFGRTYWILIAFCLAPVIPLSRSLTGRVSITVLQTARQSLNCLRFVYLLDDPFSFTDTFFLVALCCCCCWYFLWHFQMSDLSGPLVRPWLSCNQVRVCVLCVCVCLQNLFATAVGRLSSVFTLPSTQHLARLFWHFAWILNLLGI